MGLAIPAADARVITEAFRAAEQALGGPGSLLKRFGTQILAEIAENFRQGGRPTWQPLAPSTLAARRGGGGRPLHNTGKYRNSFDMRILPREVVVFSNNPVSVWMELGTKPHVIRAKNAKALAIPTGPQTLSGLGRSKPTGRGSYIFNPGKTKRVPKRLASRVGKAVVPYKSVIFRREVHHPGTVPRPVLPTEEQLTPKLVAIADDYVRSLFRL